MPKNLYAVLLVSRDDGKACIVVCETQNDFKEMLRHIRNRGDNVSTLAICEGDFRQYPISLNDYEL